MKQNCHGPLVRVSARPQPQMDFADGCRAIDEVVLGTGVKIALAATHFYGFGVARQWSWDTWLNRGKKKGRGPDVGPRLFRLPTLQGCLRPLLSRKATGGEVPPEVPGCLIAATQLVARQVFHAVGASGYLDCVLRIGSQIGRRSSETVLLELSSCTHTLALIGVVVPYLTSLKVVEVPTFGFAGSFGVVITVFGSIDSEKSAKMPVSRGYPVTPLGGIKLLSMTVGAVLSLGRTSSNLPPSTCTVVLSDSLPATSVAVTSKVCAVDCSLTPVR